jgi:hypothetical protein
MALSRRNFLSAAPAAAVLAPLPSATLDAGLINPDAVRASLPRLFSGSWSEILDELLQNAQRAGATLVTIEDQLDRLVFQDDGCGLDGTLESFRLLLSIGDSGWEESVQEQSPLGLGLHALLAHDDVRTVTLESGGRKIVLDAKRWWHDKDYYTAWPKLLQDSSVKRGFRVEAQRPREVHSTSLGMQTRADGYRDLLRIRYNGALLAPAVPDAANYQICSYLGNAVWLPKTGACSGTRINWYGQYVEPGLSHYGGPRIEVMVRSGTPFTMQSPARKGVVQNEAWQAFQLWLAARVGELLIEQPSAVLLHSYLRLFPALGAKVPWCLLRELGDTNSEVYSYAELQRECVLDYDAYDLVDGTDLDSEYDATQHAHDLADCGAELPRLVRAHFCDAARLNLVSLRVVLGPVREVERLPKAISVRESAKLEWLDSQNRVVRSEAVQQQTFVTESCSYDIADAGGMIVCGAEPDWEELLMAFFEADDDGDDHDVQRDRFSKTVDCLVAELQGQRSYMHGSDSVLDLARHLVEGTTVVPIYEGRQFWGLEITKPGQEPVRLKII